MKKVESKKKRPTILDYYVSRIKICDNCGHKNSLEKSLKIEDNFRDKMVDYQDYYRNVTWDKDSISGVFDTSNGNISCISCHKVLDNIWKNLRKATLNTFINVIEPNATIYKDESKKENKLYSVIDFNGKDKIKIKYENERIKTVNLRSHLKDTIGIEEYKDNSFYRKFCGDNYRIMVYYQGNLLASKPGDHGEFIDYADLFDLVEIKNPIVYCKYLSTLSKKFKQKAKSLRSALSNNLSLKKIHDYESELNILSDNSEKALEGARFIKNYLKYKLNEEMIDWFYRNVHGYGLRDSLHGNLSKEQLLND